MMLEFRNVSLAAQEGKVLTRLSFVAAEGRVTCLVGAGGTAVLRAAMGLLPVREGFVSIDGEPVTALSASVFRRLMAYVPRRLETIGTCPPYPAPTAGDVFRLKANRHLAGSGSLLDVAERLERPVLLVDSDEASPEWLRKMAEQGRTVLVASRREDVNMAADQTVYL